MAIKHLEKLNLPNNLQIIKLFHITIYTTVILIKFIYIYVKVSQQHIHLTNSL